MYGAHILAIRGNFDEALTIVRSISERLPITLVNSVNPMRLEGQQTAAFEICEELGSAPDHLCIPVGNAGNISAYWKGFLRFKEEGIVTNTPRMHGFQAAGAAALVHGRPVPNPETFATAIRIGNPASAHLAMAAVHDSNGSVSAVTDDEIREAYKLIASEGIFAEPASAASVAGLLKSHAAGSIREGDTVVCVLTGNGLKDPDNAMRLGTAEPDLLDANEHDVLVNLEKRL
jgi:threonine synthase